MPHFLPDGRHVVFAIGTGSGSRLAVLLLADGQRRDLLPGGTPHYLSSGHLLFSEAANLRVVPFDGETARPTGPVSPAVDSTVVFKSQAGLEGAWFAATRAGDLPTRTELWTMTRGQPPTRLFDSTANSGNGTFSPVGGWLAYVSDETGEREVYVRRFPGTERGIQVSVDGGEEPVWSRDGRELYYRRADSLMAVAVTTTSELRVGQPVELWRRAYWAQDFLRPNYDVAADGRFLMLKRTDASAGMTRHVTVALNWIEELRRRESR